MRRLILCGALVLAGCASAPTPPTTTLAFRPIQSQFVAAGRLSADNGENAISGRFDWQHTPMSDRWDFFSPLGQIVARVHRDGSMATLVTASGDELTESFDALVQRVLGMAVPVGALPRWIQAGVAASEDVREMDALGRPVRIVDDGWQVRYLAYADEAADARPRTIEVSRGAARLKLVIDQWQ